MESLSLDGIWSFELDHANEGVGERWYTQPLAHQLTLPGGLQQQGFGDDVTVNTQFTGDINMDAWKHNPKYAPYREPGNVKIPFFLTPSKVYVGPAWYQREIDIPVEWAGKRVVLFLERTHWKTTAWIDDREISTNESLSVPHEYDLGSNIAPGKHRLTIRINNNVMHAVGTWAHSVTDQTQGNWNGVIGKIELRCTSTVYIADVQTYGNIADRSVKLKIEIGNSSGKSGNGVIKVGNLTKEISWDTFGATVELDLLLGAHATLWDEFSPNLQKIVVQLDGEHVSDEREVIFGLREVARRERDLLVNGRKTFLRGTLECAIFPKTGYPPTDVESWKKLMRTCQSFGLNHIRFHSWCPPEAAFVAADELGVYLQVEICAWARLGDGLSVEKWLYEEAARITRAYGNHPSFILMAYGNEPSGDTEKRNAWITQWVKHWQQREPRRLHTTGSGWPILPCSDFHVEHEKVRGAIGWQGKDYRDGVNLSPVAPLVVHEMGQWCVYPNFDEIAKYDGYFRAKNFEIFRDELAANGMIHQAYDFLINSGKLQTLLYKEEIEAALRTPGIAGVQLLDLHDFPGQGTALVGVLDAFWDNKGYVTAEEYKRFYTTTVPLARVLKNVWSNAETFSASVEVAHYGAAVMQNASVRWQLASSTAQVLASGTFEPQSLVVGGVNNVGTISIELASIHQPSMCKLTVSIDGTEFTNDWMIWVYPTVEAALSSDVLVTQSSEQAKAALEQGRKVIYMPALNASHRVLTFEPIFWNYILFPTQPRCTLGLLNQPNHPALALFPTQSHSNWQWADIANNARGMLIDALPKDIQPIVQPIDDWNSNNKLAMIFECKVGKGKLLVVGADLPKLAIESLASRQLLHSLTTYAASAEFNPTVAVDWEQLATLLL